MVAGITTTAAALALMTLGGLWWQTVETTLRHDTVARLGLQTPPVITLAADPLLDFPRGRIPRVQGALRGARWNNIPLPEVVVTLEDVHLAPQALLGLAAPRLCAPADLDVSCRANAQELTLALFGLSRLPELQKISLPPGPLRRIFGSPVALEQPQAVLTNGQVQLQAAVVGPDGRRKPVVAQFGLHSPEGQTLRLEKLSVRINGQAVPRSLLKLLTPQLPPLVDLRPLAPPGARLRINTVAVGPEQLTLGVSGQLPAHEAPWLRPPGWPLLGNGPAGE